MIKNFDIRHESYWLLKVVKSGDCRRGNASKFQMKTRCFMKKYFEKDCYCHRYTILKGIRATKIIP